MVVPKSVSYKAEFHKILLDVMLKELCSLESKDRRTSQTLSRVVHVMNFQHEDKECSIS